LCDLIEPHWNPDGSRVFHGQRDVAERAKGRVTRLVGRHAALDVVLCLALEVIGNVTLTMEDTRAVRIPVWLDQIAQDARDSVRMLRRNRRSASS
jgi:hypothetical protein